MPASDSKRWSPISPMVVGASSSPFVSHPVKVCLVVVLVCSRGEPKVSTRVFYGILWFQYLDKRVAEDKFLVAGGGGGWLLGFLGVILISCYIGSLFSILLFLALGMA
ncbi:unnamed protein product [Prunus armeniaca]|uniref:Transmembrane protein n=1 Tax=Prunus armeniaca TaxID=36596 RepID=A0A6J5W216_PRUAR|nr:unnamed protein product [Prunus armeniaca]CAB4294042.1 unnamed protein product [Prunus armeniaca]